MDNELRRAFDKVQADDALKLRTLRYVNAEIYKRRRSSAKPRPRLRLAVACSVILILVLAGGFSYNLYFTPVAYVDVDVNPSIGLTLNRFDRVIYTHAYNDDGAEILNEANIRFKTYNEAMRILLDTVIANGYLSEDGLVSLTVQANGGSAENEILERLTTVVASSLTHHRSHAQLDVFSVTSEVRLNAHGHHISPAKYIAILELQEVDPTATFENCAGHNINEIRERTREHGSSHHDENNDHHGEDSNQQNGGSDNSGGGNNQQNGGSNHHGEGNQQHQGGNNPNASSEDEPLELDNRKPEQHHDEPDNYEYIPISPDGNGGNKHHGGSGNHNTEPEYEPPEVDNYEPGEHQNESHGNPHTPSVPDNNEGNHHGRGRNHR